MFTASRPEMTEETRAFLQRRLAAFGLGGGALYLFFWSFRAVGQVAGGHPETLLHPSMGYHFLAGFSLLAVWILCRSGIRSPRFVRVVETVALIVCVAFTVAMGAYIPLWSSPNMIVLMAVTFGFALRSIYVPSSARRTLFLCVAAGVPIFIGTYLHYLRIDMVAWSRVAPELSGQSAHDVAYNITVNSAAWWLCSTVLCTAASRVIYGLRQEAHQARRLGQYTLVKKLGEGSMGEVYQAHHAMLRRPTAIKLLRPEKAGEKALARFEREVQTTARLTHPNTVTIFDYGRTPDGMCYYVMEYLQGANLEEVVELDGAQPAARVAHILEQVASALTEAHAMGSIHRDIKPANIILCEQGGRYDVAKVVDFGLVKMLDAGSDPGLTNPGLVTGTPLYMSPEALKDPELVDERSDLYALGAVGYFLLTGTHVFRGKSVMEVLGHHLHTEPEPPGKRLGAEVPEALQKLILACLQKEPEQRPRSADELRRALVACEPCGRWSEEQARAWWDRWGEKLRRRKAGEALPESGETLLDIDLKDRGNEKRS
jgi:hypothetical protein